MFHKILILALMGCALNVREAATREVDLIGLGVYIEEGTVAVLYRGPDVSPDRILITQRQATRLQQLAQKYYSYQGASRNKVFEWRTVCSTTENHGGGNCNCATLIDNKIDRINMRLGLYRRKALTILNIAGPSNGHSGSHNRGASGSSESLGSDSGNEDD